MQQVLRSAARATTDVLPERLDALISFLRSTHRGSGCWLTVSFDDGYEDSALYIASGAA